mgnify:CR=1 FL=1
MAVAFGAKEVSSFSMLLALFLPAYCCGHPDHPDGFKGVSAQYSRFPGRRLYFRWVTNHQNTLLLPWLGYGLLETKTPSLRANFCSAL